MLLRSVSGRLVAGFGVLLMILAMTISTSAWLALEHRSSVKDMEDRASIALLLDDAQLNSMLANLLLERYLITDNAGVVSAIGASMETVEQDLRGARALEAAHSESVRAVTEVERLDELIAGTVSVTEAFDRVIDLQRNGDAEGARASLEASVPEINAFGFALGESAQLERNEIPALQRGAAETAAVVFWLLVASGAVGSAIAIATAVAVARSILKPLFAVESTALAVAAGDLDARAKPDGPAEIASLGRSLNQMTESLVSALKRREFAIEQLKGSEATQRALLEALPDVLFRVDQSGAILDFQESGHGPSSHESGAHIGRTVQEALPPAAAESCMAAIERALRTDEVQAFEFQRDESGTAREYEARVSASRASEVVVVLWDITERKQFETHLTRAANYDPLTSLFSRRRFEEEMERALMLASENDQNGALLFLDLDQFKDVNDGLGHHVGDEVLIGVGDVLRQSLDDGVYIGRFGGDEFTILLPETTALEAMKIADGVLRALRERAFVVRGRPITMTGSIGIAAYPEHGGSAEELFSAADSAMYSAKEAGRNRIHMATSNGEGFASREGQLNLRRHIAQALENGTFRLYAQPILEISTNSVTHHELLIRLPLADGRVLLPAQFLGVADRAGFFPQIDRWVVREAIRLIAEHQGPGEEARVGVNLSSNALADPGMFTLIREEISAAGISPSSLIFELTETNVISNISDARRFVTDVRELGCQFALDDFGIGASSFYVLQQLPVDILKIDGNFVRELPRSSLDRHLVRSIIEMAHGMDVQIVAEFVESEEILAILRECGADYAQGYHIGRPIDASIALSGRAEQLDRAA